MPHQYAIEIEQDDVGFHFVVLDADTDEVVRVGLSYATCEGAERDATAFIYRLLSQLQSA
jgi:hypothetical protein